MKLKTLGFLKLFLLHSSAFSYDIISFKDEQKFVNHLQNDFAGMIEFVQSRSISPEDTLKLVTNRRALLLLTPKPQTEVKSIELTAFRSGKILGKLMLKPPSFFPATDQDTALTSNLPRIKYSTQAWSVPLPAAWMQQGLTLTFMDQDGNIGVLAKEKLNFGGASELFLTNIRIALFSKLRDPEPLEIDSLHTAHDFYQTIPVAKLKLGNYLPLEIKDKVVMPDGKIYTPKNLSTAKADWHNGDMREDILKGVFGKGISRANYGLTSSSLVEENMYNFKQIQIHRGTGNYQSGENIIHGGSGGNGLATLDTTIGNEFSHELAHSFNLTHYHEGEKYNNQNEYSGWGYDANRNIMLGSLLWKKWPDKSNKITWKNMFDFNSHPMADAEENGNISKYTQFTNFTSEVIQRDFESYSVISKESPTGYKIWNDHYKDMLILWNTGYPRPKYFDVPVMTLVGFYDPEGQLQSHIYPELYGNLGYVYTSQNTNESRCWLSVESDIGIEKIPLVSSRIEKNKMNIFHVNFINENILYKSANIFCEIAGESKQLAMRKIQPAKGKLPKSVIISDVDFPLVQGEKRFLKIKILSSYFNKKHTGVSEIDLFDKNKVKINKENWLVKYVTCEENMRRLYARNAIDDNNNTSWHTEYSIGWNQGKPIPFPHEIVIDLGEFYNLEDNYLTISQNKIFDGIKEYEVSASADFENWEVMARGHFSFEENSSGVLLNKKIVENKSNHYNLTKRNKRSDQNNYSFKTFYQITNGSLCLNAQEEKVVLGYCNKKNLDQHWSIDSVGKFYNKGVKKCVHVNSLNNLEELTLIECERATRWKYFSDKRIATRNDDQFVLDDAGNNEIVLYQHHGGSNQQWELYLTENANEKTEMITTGNILRTEVAKVSKISFASSSNFISGYIYLSNNPKQDLLANSVIDGSAKISYRVIKNPRCGILRVAENYGGFVYIKQQNNCNNFNNDFAVVEVSEEKNSKVKKHVLEITFELFKN